LSQIIPSVVSIVISSSFSAYMDPIIAGKLGLEQNKEKLDSI
jgi:hypothetical protein